MTIVQTELRIDTTLSDDELFTLMSLKDEDEESARRAFDVFHGKYARLLWTLCHNECSRHRISDVDTIAKEIFWDTMMQIYEKPYYDPSKAKVSTWMSTIAKRKVYDLIKLQENNHLPLYDDCAIQPDVFRETEDEFVLPEREILEKALACLSDLERDVLMTYFRYKCGKKHLPDEVLKDLVRYHNKTSDNIRQIRKRAFDKVKIFIKDNSDFLS